MKITRLDAMRCMVGEAPVWDVEEQALFLLDIANRQVHRLDPATGAVKSWETPTLPTALALCASGGALVAMQDKIHALDFATGTFQPAAVAEGQPTNATLNDGKVDRQGRFVIGSCCTDFDAPTPVGGIYGLARGRCQRLAGDITFSNGTCFSPDGRTLYFADSARHAVFAYEYEVRTGRIGERRLLAETHALGGIPDGATVDGSGRVWVAINEGGKLAAFSPGGELEQVIELPVSRPGSVAFGGPTLSRLFVTTIDPAYFGEAPDNNAGYVYVVDGLDTCGLPELRYAG